MFVEEKFNENVLGPKILLRNHIDALRRRPGCNVSSSVHEFTLFAEVPEVYAL
jgi:hypothetical protein